MDEDSLRRDLEGIASASAGAVEFNLLPEGPAPLIEPYAGETGPLEAREFRRDVGRAFEIASFSSLVEEADRGAAAGEGLRELPDHDERTPGRATGEPAEPSGIFAFPRGPRAGKCLHAIFERLDFACAERGAVAQIVGAALAEYGYEQSWCDTLCDMIGRVVEAPLAMGRRCQALGPRAAEMPARAFLLLPPQGPYPGEAPGALLRCGMCADELPQSIGSLRFHPVAGFMRGYIDLVFEHGDRFYLIDWKSNYLGSRPEDYGPETLAAVMRAILRSSVPSLRRGVARVPEEPGEGL